MVQLRNLHNKSGPRLKEMRQLVFARIPACKFTAASDVRLDRLDKIIG